MAMIIGANVIAAASAAGAMTCVTPEPPLAKGDPLKGYRQLDDAELRRLLVGQVVIDVERRPPAVADANYVDQFEPNGVWRTSGGRASYGGRYSIRGGAVCTVDRRENSRCRTFWRDARGHHLTVEQDSAGSKRWVHRVVIGPRSLAAGQPARTCG